MGFDSFLRENLSLPFRFYCLPLVDRMPKGNKKVNMWGEYGKRFNNGHQCFTSAQSTFMQEIYSKNERSRVHFKDTYHLLKKPRDPTMGELTSRENAEYLVPLTSIAAQTVVQPQGRTKSAEELNSAQEKLRGMTMFSKLLADVARCESLRQRRERMNQESVLVETILEHKRVCANAGLLGPTHMNVANKTAQELSVPNRPF